jgi:hypothetical protein
LPNSWITHSQSLTSPASKIKEQTNYHDDWTIPQKEQITEALLDSLTTISMHSNLRTTSSTKKAKTLKYPKCWSRTTPIFILMTLVFYFTKDAFTYLPTKNFEGRSLPHTTIILQ